MGGIPKNNPPNWLRQDTAAIQLSNSKGAKTDRIDVTKLGGAHTDSKVNNQYLIALESNKIIEDTDKHYQPFWKRQVAVKVGDATDGKIQYALVNRNSLIKRLSMDEKTLDFHIKEGTVDDYINSRLSELENIKSCFSEANPIRGSKGERRLRLDLAAQFPNDDGIHIKDERNQYRIAMNRLELKKEPNYCAGWDEIAVHVGTTTIINDEGHEEEVNQFAILNKNSLIQHLGYPKNYSGPKAGEPDYWDTLKQREKLGIADGYIKEIISEKIEEQNDLNEALIQVAKGNDLKWNEYDNEEARRGPLRIIKEFMQENIGRDDELYESFKLLAKPDLKISPRIRNDFLSHLTPKLWWTVPKEGLSEEKAALIRPPSQIALKEPTTRADWDKEDKFTLTAAHDFIETFSINHDDLKKRGELALHCVVNPGTVDEISGWVTYKINDLQRLGLDPSELTEYINTSHKNFLPVLHNRLEVLRKQNAPLDDEDINNIPIIE